MISRKRRTTSSSAQRVPVVALPAPGGAPAPRAPGDRNRRCARRGSWRCRPACASLARSLIRRWICSSTLSMRARTASSFTVLGEAEVVLAPRRREVFLAAMATESDEPRRENARNAADARQQILADDAVNVDERVRILAPRLVEKIRDVDPRIGQDAGQNLADHVGDVAVGYREARGAWHTWTAPPPDG